MLKTIKRSKIVKLSILKANDNETYSCIYKQLKYSLFENWKWKLEDYDEKLIFVNYIGNKQDLIFFKEEYEKNSVCLNFNNKNEFIDAINPLLIGVCILYNRNEYYDFKYNSKIRYIDLIETFIQGIGIGKRLLNRIETMIKKQLLPFFIIERANKYWYKILSHNINLNTHTTLKNYINDNLISRAINWKYLYKVITKNQLKIIKNYSCDFVTNILGCLTPSPSPK